VNLQKSIERLDRKFWTNKKILITGGTGFFGKSLTLILESLGCPDFKIITRNKNLSGNRYLYCDLAKKNEVGAIKEEIESAQFVFILSSAFPKVSTKDISFDEFLDNIIMVKNLIDVIPISVQKIVLASSTDVYGILAYGTPANECHGINPATYYALSKYIQEKIIEYSIKREIKYLILRYTSIYGENEPHVKFLPVLLDCIVNNKKFTVFGDASEKRDFINVEDAAIITLYLVQEGATGIFNISTGKGTAINELLAIAEKFSGREISLEYRERVKPKVDLIYDNHKLTSFIKHFQFKPLHEGIKEQYEILKAIK
jgi:UDP-glucose 4-epimerase